MLLNSGTPTAALVTDPTTSRHTKPIQSNFQSKQKHFGNRIFFRFSRHFLDFPALPKFSTLPIFQYNIGISDIPIENLVGKFVKNAIKNRLDGAVCSPHEIKRVRKIAGKNFIIVVYFKCHFLTFLV